MKTTEILKLLRSSKEDYMLGLCFLFEYSCEEIIQFFKNNGTSVQVGSYSNALEIYINSSFSSKPFIIVHIGNDNFVYSNLFSNLRMRKLSNEDIQAHIINICEKQDFEPSKYLK